MDDRELLCLLPVLSRNSSWVQTLILDFVVSATFLLVNLPLATLSALLGKLPRVLLLLFSSDKLPVLGFCSWDAWLVMQPGCAWEHLSFKCCPTADTYLLEGEYMVPVDGQMFLHAVLSSSLKVCVLTSTFAVKLQEYIFRFAEVSCGTDCVLETGAGPWGHVTTWNQHRSEAISTLSRMATVGERYSNPCVFPIWKLQVVFSKGCISVFAVVESRHSKLSAIFSSSLSMSLTKYLLPTSTSVKNIHSPF